MSFGMNYDTAPSGDIVPVLKFDARAGRFFRVDRVDGTNTPTDITRSLKMVADLENVECGWINFATGGAPDFVVAKIGTPMPARPSPDHKQGVRILLKLSKDCGGDIRELSTTAKSALRGLEEIHTAYQAARESQAGQLPVLALKDTIGITTGSGAQKSTAYQPVFEIVGWSARPTDLVFKPKNGGASAAAGSTPSSSTPPSTGSKQVDAPKPAPAPAPAADDLEDFG